MRRPALSFAEIELLTGDRFGVSDTPCPACGPDRQLPHNRLRKVLRIWREKPDFATFSCARCGLGGYARRGDRARVRRPVPSPASSVTSRQDSAIQMAKAASMWRNRLPAAGTTVETNLRQVRKFTATIPATLAYLPPNERYPAAMIAAFGLAEELEPSVLTPPTKITGVHLTRLAPDGSRPTQGGPSKITIGPSLGQPICLASPNDLLGLCICEGIETGLSIAQMTGLGCWAAGSASRMPALADLIPDWIDCLTIAVEDDDAGRRNAEELARRLGARGIHAEMREVPHGS